ncbi:MAG TPA: NAD(P)H-binding protein [Candidatus Saccharimonadales bacterium]|nr:NAD(P)H-binding protein [Candidatus Saccharimonadales bacterium]
MNVVTGAFGYIGRYIARHLLDSGEQVRTVTTHPDKPNPFGPSVEALPYHFDKPQELTASLRGASTLYNTYWIRFEHGGATFDQAVANTATLFQCARSAGVTKIVHISVTQASEESPLPYYRGKARQEKALIASGVPYAIVRPTLVFGVEDILVNNIAWLLRKFPVFPVFGSGQYRLQPVYAGDLAAIAVSRARDPESGIIDAVGPETYTFRDFVALMAAGIGSGARVVPVPPALGIALGKMIGIAVRDVILTTDELRGLMDSLLTSDQAPNGSTLFSAWLESNKDRIGTAYTSELGRHFRWRATA